MAKTKTLILLEYNIVVFFLTLVKITPLFLLKILSKFVGIIAYLLLPGSRKIIKRNLSLSYNNSLTNKQKNKLVFQNFLYMGNVIFEILKFPYITNKKIIENTMFENLHFLDDALKKGKGVIVCSGHYGNWEWTAGACAIAGYKISAIFRPLDNPLINNLLIKIREDKGYNIIPRKLSIRRGIKALEENQILALMVDQNAAVNGEFVPFYGIPASTMKGVSWFTKKQGNLVLCVTNRTDKTGKHVISFSPPLEISGDEYQDLLKINQYLEKSINIDPTQYFWIHPRWKKRPDGEINLYK